MTAHVVNLQSGGVVGVFPDYVAAATYRRDVLIPRLADPSRCPYHVINPDDPDYVAAAAEHDRYRVESGARIAALPTPATQGELFTAESLGVPA